jgi:RNA polymerase sporulation-specific sigma factor
VLANVFLLLVNSTFLMLRLGKRTGSFPRPLRADEERSYVERWLGGDLEARNKLIEHNLRLVAHIIKKYYTPDSDQDDLISIGTIGLIKGISTYSPDKGVRLATYASRCIENEVLMHFRGIKKSAGDLSLSDSIDVDGDGNSLSLMDIIAQEDDLADRLSAQETSENLRRFVDERLSKREAEIIHMRYGLDGAPACTQREAAAVCGISRSYVSRIEKKALEKLRKYFEDDAS